MNESNTKIDTKMIDVLFKKLTTKEFSLSIGLSQYLSDNNILKYNNKIADGKTLSKALGQNYETFKRILPELIKKGVFAKIIRQSDTYANKTKKCIVGNPFIFISDLIIDDDILDVFIGSNILDGEFSNIESEVTRNSKKYKEWIEKVFERDNYTCQRCNSKLNIQAHHILPYSQYKELRTDINNGITLCERCHSSKIYGSFHWTYGTINNTKEQLEEYINSYKEKNIM